MINEPKLITIRRAFPRPTSDMVEAFQDVTTCWIGDAMGGRGAIDSGIRPLVGGTKRISGTAITAQVVANSNAAIFAAIQYAQPGDIVLAAAEAFSGAAVVGDVLAGMAKNKGVAALVIDGMVRDIEGLREVGLPIWARGLTPNSCSREGIGTVGQTIVLGGQTISSGDIVVLDEDGVIAISGQSADDILAAVEDIKLAEAKILASVAAGATAPPAITAILESDRVVYVDESPND